MLSRLQVLTGQPQAGPRRTSHAAARRRRRRRFRRRLHRHLGEPVEHVRLGHADDRQLQGGHRRPHGHQPPPGRPRRAPASSTSRTPAASSGAFTLSRTAPVDSDGTQPAVGQAQPHGRRLRRLLERHADLRRRRRRDQVHGGTLAAMGTAGHTVAGLGTYAADEKHRYQFTRPARRLGRQRVPGRQLVGRVRLQRRLGLGGTGNTESARHGGRDGSDSPRRTPRVRRGARRRGAVRAARAGSLRSCGWERYAIVSGSMTGTYDRGSLVFAEVVPVADLKVGDVITYSRRRAGDHLITHRISWIGRDDAASASSAPRATRTRSPTRGPSASTSPTQARVRFGVPYAGYALSALGRQGRAHAGHRAAGAADRRRQPRRACGAGSAWRPRGAPLEGAA